MCSMDWSNEKLETVKAIKEKISTKDKSQGPTLRSCYGNRMLGHMEIGKSCLKSILEHSSSGLTQEPGSLPRHGSRTSRASDVYLSIRGSALDDLHWPFCFHSKCKKE